MRTLALAAFLLTAPALFAQANDYAGLRVYTSNTAGAPTPLVCGTPFTCTPFAFTATPGSPVTAFVSGNLGQVYIIAASLDTTSMLCIPFGIPGLVNNYALTPGTDVIVALGTCTVPDNGRCNGGASPAQQLFTIPPGLSGAVLFQAVAGSPLSAGGSGLAFSTPVLMSF